MPLWRMHLNHVWMSRFVVKGEWIREAMACQGMSSLSLRYLGQLERHVGGSSKVLLKIAVRDLTLSWSKLVRWLPVLTTHPSGWGYVSSAGPSTAPL